MRSVWIAVLLVLAVGSVGLAQSGVVPHAVVGFETVQGKDGSTTELETTFTTIGVGATADLGNGLIASGTYAIGSGGKVKTSGGSSKFDTNKLTHFHLSLKYALDVGTLALGPLVDYSSATWTMKNMLGELSQSASNLGFGAFVSTKLDPVSVSASYVHRPNAKLKEKIGNIELTFDDGSAGALTIDASASFSDSLTFVGSYEADTWYSKDNGKFVSSGFKVGVSYAF